MNNEKKYIISTVDSYNRENTKQLYNIFKTKHSLLKDTSQISMFDDEDVRDSGEWKNVAKACLEKYSDAIQLYYDNLFFKGYKYSVFYHIDSIDKFFESASHIPLYNAEKIDIFDENKIYRLDNENDILFLMNKTFRRFDEIDGRELLLHYPMLIIYHKNSSIVEFRFDALKNDVLGEKRNADFFINIIDFLKSLFHSSFDCHLEYMDLRKLIIFFKEDGSQNKINSQKTVDRHGGKTTLQASDSNFILPIIDDLKELIYIKLQKELAKNAIIKEELENFLKQYDSKSEWENIEVTFDADNPIAAKRYKVQFKFNYFGRRETLVCFMYNNSIIGNERMNNVARYIGEKIKK